MQSHSCKEDYLPLCLWHKKRKCLKPRTDITRSPKLGYQWPHKKDSCPPKFSKKKTTDNLPGGPWGPRGPGSPFGPGWPGGPRRPGGPTSVCRFNRPWSSFARCAEQCALFFTSVDSSKIRDKTTLSRTIWYSLHTLLEKNKPLWNFFL